MKVLVIGSGGREHALVWKLNQSKEIKKLYCAPGNAGTYELAKNIPISANDLKGLLEFSQKEKIDLTVVGPEEPLALGIVDKFTKSGLEIFGPTRKAAQIEASKIFAKKFMKRFAIPTADFEVFDDYNRALSYLRSCSFPKVIKADGLAAGKGVSVCHSLTEAEEALKKMMLEKVFSGAGESVVIEEYLAGEEASILAFTDGETIIPMIPAQDHKPVFDGDKGPNTGGMGCYAPAPIVTPSLLQAITKQVLIPTIQGMKKIGRPYKGVLYAGLMIKGKGFKVLEFNCRFGDPETQVILPLLQSDLLEIIQSCLAGRLGEVQIKWEKGSCVCVVLASGGYPLKYEKGKEIIGCENLRRESNTVAFHAGTAIKVVTNGGRVLGITSTAPTIKQAISKAYQSVKKVSFEKMHYRIDIGAKASRS